MIWLWPLNWKDSNTHSAQTQPPFHAMQRCMVVRAHCSRHRISCHTQEKPFCSTAVAGSYLCDSPLDVFDSDNDTYVMHSTGSALATQGSSSMEQCRQGCRAETTRSTVAMVGCGSHLPRGGNNMHTTLQATHNHSTRSCSALRVKGKSNETRLEKLS
jgi:hypothetical protein